MPNNVKNHLSFTGNKNNILSLIKFVESNKSIFDFNKIIECPPIFENIYSKYSPATLREEYFRMDEEYDVMLSKEECEILREQYGHIGWYDWRTAKWGTKWNAYNVGKWSTKRGAQITFETAWESPEPVLRELMRTFSSVSLKVKCTGEVHSPYSYCIKASGVPV